MSQQTLNFSSLIEIIEEATKTAQSKVDDIQSRSENVSIGDMFEMQMLMNKLTQLSEMSTAVVSASNSAIRTMAQNVNR